MGAMLLYYLYPPPIHYIVFAIPHKKEIPSLKRTVHVLFFLLYIDKRGYFG
jgi:hypothetical protein